MRVLRSARWLLLAVLVSLVPASSYAGVFISVGFGPPVLPVYVQPACPEPSLMWTPGYWAYGPDGYYWVPGAWVPAPYYGALWTPPYWGWEGGLYVFHEGYWGPHVGYYGGVNYGFGYMGIGFAGGEWRGNEFAYNTAVVNVNRTVIHNTYINETIVHNTTIINNNRVSYNGGPGGIEHQASAQEQVAMHESHMAPTSFQQQHVQTARNDHAAYFNANHGRPQSVVAARPLAVEHHPAPASAAVNNGARENYSARPEAPVSRNPGGRPESQPAPMNRPESHPAAGYQPQAHPAPESRPEYRPAPQSRPAPEYRPEPQARPEQHAQPESHPEHHESEPKPKEPHR